MGNGINHSDMQRFDIYLTNLDPTLGTEIKKTRPAIIISPDEMNDELATAIIAPMTTTKRHWPSRIEISFKGKDGQIALDQIRAVDKTRLIKKIGTAQEKTCDKILKVLQEIFS